MVTLAMLSSAIETYRADFEGAIPEGGDKYPALPPGGANNLVEALTGYKTNDGEEGFGFRVITRGKVYGPYVDTAKVEISTGSAPPTFLDSSGYTIGYYRYESNGFAGDGGLYKTTVTIDEYCKDGGDRYFRTDYALVSPGPNGKSERFATVPGSDDTTNLFSED
jgi:hypothetical protein